jgi:hypothetical protein
MNELELLEQLEALEKQHPERFERIKKLPEWGIILEEGRKLRLAVKAREDSADGLIAYYEGKYGFKPKYHIERWYREIYAAHEQNKGYTINGYRGCWKTVSMATFVEHRIGLEPEKTNLIISAEGSKADEMLENITTTIEFLPWWKTVFPNVVPDKGRWSGDGYWVVDTSMTYEEWTAKRSYTIDPTLVGGGLESKKVNGKHPSGVCLTDDLHGLNNSVSETQRKGVVRFYTSELSKTFKRENGKLVTWPINIGVPWGVSGDKSDVHQVISKSGGFSSSVHPAMRRANEGDENAVYIDGVNEETGAVYDDIVGWWILSNPDIYGAQEIKNDRGLGKFDFWQQIMMDIQAARSGGIKYYIFPAEEIDKTWPCITGVDPSYTFKERKEYELKSSHFAAGNVLKRPRGGAVLQGGILEQCSTREAAGHLMSTKSNFTNHDFFAVENVGMGQLMKENMSLYAPSLVIVGSDLGGIRMKGEKAGKAKNKVDRIKMELAPWLENATILISTEKSDYLDAIRDGLDNISELDPVKPDKRLDALDSFYHAVKAMPDVLQQTPMGDEFPSIFEREPAPHPLSGRRERNRKWH